MFRRLLVLSFSLLPLATSAASITSPAAAYCHAKGGTVEMMAPEFATSHGLVQGPQKAFCNYFLSHGFVSIGLDTFASERPSLAATYIKRLKPIQPHSLLWQGPYPNPAHNVCKNLGGAAIGYVTNGSFANRIGQVDICVFGDGSMVSGWSLIYMASHREGYDEIKASVNAEPLDFLITT